MLLGGQPIAIFQVPAIDKLVIISAVVDDQNCIPVGSVLVGSRLSTTLLFRLEINRDCALNGFAQRHLLIDCVLPKCRDDAGS